MAERDFYIETALNTVNAVARKWQDNPFLWARERDIQAEIGGRLSQIFTLQGLGDVKGSYGHNMRDFEDTQTWSRVAFEPYVPYVYGEAGEATRCHPDVVIWDDLNDRKPPNYQDYETWPIAWACEIKYGSRDSGDWDRWKLRLLIEQERIAAGCTIQIHYNRTQDKVGIKECREDVRKDAHVGQLVHYAISVPNP